MTEVQSSAIKVCYVWTFVEICTTLQFLLGLFSEIWGICKQFLQIYKRNLLYSFCVNASMCIVHATKCIDAIRANKNTWIMSSYAHFAAPTCRQATMQTYRVCKITEDWRQQWSSDLVKRQQQKSTTLLLSPVSRIASMLQRSAIKLQTRILACLQVGVPNGRHCLLFIYSCSQEKHLYDLFWILSCYTFTPN